MLRLAVFVLLLSGCSSTPFNPCGLAGGQCVALSPESCRQGRLGSQSCGPPGVACCLPSRSTGSMVVNPASSYCATLGYRVSAGQADSECLFPDGTSCEAFAFFRGSCGSAWTRCAQEGGTITNETFDGGTFFGEFAKCTLPGGTTCRESDFAATGTCQ